MNMAENMRQESAMANLRQSHETLQRWKFLVAGGNKVCERDVRRVQAEVDVAISLAEKAGISAEEIAEVTGAKPPATKLREEISRLQQQAASSEAEAVIAWKEAGILAAEVCRLEAALAVAVTSLLNIQECTRYMRTPTLRMAMRPPIRLSAVTREGR